MKPPVVETQPLSVLSPAAWAARGMTQLCLPYFRKSLGLFGSVRLPVWNRRTGHLVDGHRLVEAMIEDGWIEAEVVVVDLSETEAKALRFEIHDPRARGSWDPEKLAAVIEEIKEGAAELYDELRLLDIEIDARLEILRDRPAGEVLGQRRLFT